MTMRRTLLTVTLLTLIACGEKPTTPKEAAVATVLLQAPTTALQVGDSPVVSATLRDASGAPLNGRSVQWQSSAPTIVAVTTQSGPASTTITAIAPGTATVSATSGGATGVLTFNVSAAPELDFAIVDAQWTQAVQQADGSIPMVLDGNGAVLNVIMSSTISTRTPGALVLTIRDATSAIVRTDTVRPRAIDGTTSYTDPAAQFLLPASVLRAGLTWEVKRDPQHLVVDADATNDNFPRTGPRALSTIALPPMRIRFVPISLSAHQSITGNVTANNLPAYLLTFLRVFPRGQLSTTIGSPISSGASFGTAPSGGAQAFWVQVLSDLDVARVADANFRDAYWMGVIAPPTGFNNTAFGGFSYIPSSFTAIGAGTRTSTAVQVGWFNNAGQTADLIPHELAHAIGRRHTPCGGPSGVDPSYPFVDGRIGVEGHDVYAWASGQSSIAASRPASSGDLMGYCFPAWVSSYTYLNMLVARSLSALTADNASIATSMQREPVLVVRGTRENGRVTLLPAVTIDGFASTNSATPSTGAATVVDLIDDAGRVLLSQPVQFTELDHASVESFVTAIALKRFASNELASVRVRGAGPSATRRRAISVGGAPNLQLSSPALLEISTTGSARRRAVCADTRSAAVVVQDAESGDVLGTATGAALTFDATLGRSVYISCSDGVLSRRSSVRVTPYE